MRGLRQSDAGVPKHPPRAGLTGALLSDEFERSTCVRSAGVPAWASANDDDLARGDSRGGLEAQEVDARPRRGTARYHDVMHARAEGADLLLPDAPTLQVIDTE